MTLPNVLMVLDEVPFPLTNGGRIDCYYQAKALHELGCHVYILFAYTNRDEFEQFRMAAGSICQGYYAFPRRKRKISDFVSSVPYLVKNRAPSSTNLADIKRTFSAVQFDVVIQVHLSSYLLAQRARATVAPSSAYVHRMQNIEATLLLSTFLAAKAGTLRKFFFGLEFLKTWFYEKKVYSQVPNIAAISDSEERWLHRKVPSAKVFWIPPFFEFSPRSELNLDEQKTFEILKDRVGSRRVALLTGNFAGGMTVKQVRWFIEKVTPFIRRGVPDFCVIIAGREASSFFNEDESLIVINNYGSVNPLMKICNVFVVATTGKGGVKLKLMEALSFKKSVVSTTSGVYGSGLENLVPNTDDPERFASLCIEAINDKEKFTAVQDFFFAKYNCEINAKKMLEQVGCAVD